MGSLSQRIAWSAFGIAAALLTPAAGFAADTDPCDSLIPAAIGGPLLPKTSETAVLRWLANANYELDYRGQVFLFDTYYNRKARNRPLGFTADQVKRASVIFLGHGHFDHMSDTVPVAAQTQAPVVGAPITIDTAVQMGLPPKQAITVAGGETLHFGDVIVDVALAHHSEPAAGIQDALANLYKVELPADSPDEAALSAAVRARGTFSPDVLDKGTLAFSLTFPNGFKVLMLDSASSTCRRITTRASAAGSTSASSRCWRRSATRCRTRALSRRSIAARSASPPAVPSAGR